MRVLFNQTSTSGSKAGIGHCALQLMNHLRRLPEVKVTAFPSARLLKWDLRFKNVYRKLCALRGKLKSSRVLPHLALFGLVAWAEHLSRKKYRSWLETRKRQMFFGDLFDIYHEPNFIPVDSSLPTVTTLHDLSVLLHPEWHPAERVRWYDKEFAKTLTRSAHFIVVSQFTREQVERHLGVSPGKITCVYNAPRPEFTPLPPDKVAQVLERQDLPARYLLYVGTIEPRKNVLRLMQAYCALPEQLRREWPLLLVGQWGWNIDRERNYYENQARHRGVRHVGYLADELLPFVYNGARALIYPSLYEGFGLPPLEMLACGGAVLGSDIAAVAEVLGNQGHVVAPADVDGWRDAMLKVIIDDDWRQLLRQGAVRTARQFSWNRSAAQTLEVYRGVLGHQAGQDRRLRGASARQPLDRFSSGNSALPTGCLPASFQRSGRNRENGEPEDAGVGRTMAARH